MKLRFSDRLLTVLLAVLFLLAASAIIAESVFGAHVSDLLVRFFQSVSVIGITVKVLAVIFCLVLAWLCLRVAFRHHHRVDIDFVEQKTDGGELRVSVKAIEGLVRKCVANHEEISLESVRLENHKEGLTVLLICSTAADISIPLAVDALQKQLREYVMESTGVDIYQIQVEINDALAKLAGGTYRLHEAVIDPEARTQALTIEEQDSSVPAVQEFISQQAPVDDSIPDTAPTVDDPEAKLPQSIPEMAPVVTTEESVPNVIEDTETPVEDEFTETVTHIQEMPADNGPGEVSGMSEAENENVDPEPKEKAEDQVVQERPPIVLPEGAPEFDEDPPKEGLFGKLFGHHK